MALDPIAHSSSRKRQSSTYCIELLLRNFETKEVTNQQEVLESDKLQQQTIIKTRGNKKRNKKTTSKHEENNQNSRGRRGANKATTQSENYQLKPRSLGLQQLHK